MLEKTDRRLLIIGNGFDLSCGLKSGFSDFFNWRERELSEENPKVAANVWDEIFKSYKDEDPKWCDIENGIKDWVGGENSKARSMLEPRTLTIDSCGNSSGSWRPHNPLFGIVANEIGEDSALKEEGFLGYLLSALYSYEKSFAVYLEAEVSSCGDYSFNAANALRGLLNDDLIDERSLPVSLLNFNYTDPTLLARAKCLPIDRVRNIHGELNGGDIIFGIDSMNYMDDELTLPFTKTYRLMQLKSSVRTSTASTGLGLSDNIICIKVFGHSLAQADYSYFQSIFDAVQLYGSDTRLEFYYKPYGDKTEDEIKKEQFDRVTALLAEYSHTLDNEAHGKNLMHKLLLEDRLAVKKLDIRSYI